MQKPKTIVKVLIERVVPEDQLHWLDKDLPSEVDIEINNSIPEDQLADAALDIFHGSVAVKVLDHFSFLVMKDGEHLVPQEDHDGGSLEDEGSVL